jgi:hypothetical protein
MHLASLPELHHLDVTGTKITPAGLQALREKRPQTNMTLWGTQPDGSRSAIYEAPTGSP